MKVRELIKVLQEYDVELYCYSKGYANAQLIVEPCGDLLLADGIGCEDK